VGKFYSKPLLAMVTIRKATIIDLSAITQIYNDAIVNTVATFDAQPKTMKEQKKWFDSHDAKHPIIVAKIGGDVIGWASLSDWSDRCAYSDTAELSIYIKKEHQGKGAGKKLISASLRQGKSVGLHTIVARIESSNKVIIHVLKNFGFIRIGVMREVGRKFGRLLDVVIMQIIF